MLRKYTLCVLILFVGLGLFNVVESTPTATQLLYFLRHTIGKAFPFLLKVLRDDGLLLSLCLLQLFSFFALLASLLLVLLDFRLNFFKMLHLVN